VDVAENPDILWSGQDLEGVECQMSPWQWQAHVAKRPEIEDALELPLWSFLPHLVGASLVFNSTKTDAKGLSRKFSAFTHKSTGMLSWLCGCASTRSPEQKDAAQHYGNRD